MKTKIIIRIVGILLMSFGIIFNLQGQSIIGPKSSFMYSNPDWITNGFIIFILGIFSLITTALLDLLRSKV